MSRINIKSVILGIGIGMLLAAFLFMVWTPDNKAAQETSMDETITERSEGEAGQISGNS